MKKKTKCLLGIVIFFAGAIPFAVGLSGIAMLFGIVGAIMFLVNI